MQAIRDGILPDPLALSISTRTYDDDDDDDVVVVVVVVDDDDNDMESNLVGWGKAQHGEPHTFPQRLHIPAWRSKAEPTIRVMGYSDFLDDDVDDDDGDHDDDDDDDDDYVGERT
jgi:hypothetical protein